MFNLELQKRERVIMAVAGVVAVVLIGYWLTDGPRAMYAQSTLQLQHARSNLDEMSRWHAEVMAEQQDEEALKTRIRARGSRFDFYNFMTQVMSDADLEKRHNLETVQATASSQSFSSVKLTVQGVSMDELVGLLHRIYAADKLVALHRLTYLRAASDGKGLECSMTLVSPKA